MTRPEVYAFADDFFGDDWQRNQRSFMPIPLLLLIPSILSFMVELPNIIMGVEKAFSGKKGSGKAKKKLAMKGISTVIGAAVASKKLTKKEGAALLTNTGLLVDTAVKTLNAVDALKK